MQYIIHNMYISKRVYCVIFKPYIFYYGFCRLLFLSCGVTQSERAMFL